MPEFDIIQMFVVAVAGTVWGVAGSWIQERLAAFQALPPQWKQFTNSVITLVLPYLVTLISPYWRPEFGDSSEVTRSILILTVPLFVWLASQVGHALDPYTKKNND